MADKEILAREILETTCGTDEIFEDYDMDLFEEGFIDSFAVLNIILEIEKKTGVKLQISDIKKDDVSTVNKFIAFLGKI